ncbi:RING-H2 finger protein ATL65-like [Aristolochia californica]|uniref:RING-H2 finger protein ATL65-like n=1 Tax=Aristolochia californica TaxID=171875 RepID=UPI0035E0907A
MGPPPEYEFEWSDSPASSHQSDSTALPVDFSPPLIAIVVVVGTAFLIVTYFRIISRYILPPVLLWFQRWRNRRRRRNRPSFSASDVESPPPGALYETTAGAFHFLSPYGLHESIIKTIPLSVYTNTKRRSPSSESGGRDCAVCLLEFEENDYVRTLPVCSHAFHVDCIDIWLRSHANCPLCRAGVLQPESPFVPLMAARIRPSLDEGVLDSLFLEQRSDGQGSQVQEITAAEASPRIDATEDRNTTTNARDFLLKRSYSFSFERNLASDRMILEPATASPWRYRRGGAFWRRTSPFGSAKSRVFSFRHYRGMKSPFLRRRSYFQLSESSVRYAGGGSSRRSKSLTSPIFMRSSTAASSSSRLRCGDPEALLSPERLNGR